MQMYVIYAKLQMHCYNLHATVHTISSTFHAYSLIFVTIFCCIFFLRSEKTSQVSRNTLWIRGDGKSIDLIHIVVINKHESFVASKNVKIQIQVGKAFSRQ